MIEEEEDGTVTSAHVRQSEAPASHAHLAFIHAAGPQTTDERNKEQIRDKTRRHSEKNQFMTMRIEMQMRHLTCFGNPLLFFEVHTCWLWATDR